MLNAVHKRKAATEIKGGVREIKTWIEEARANGICRVPDIPSAALMIIYAVCAEESQA